MRRCGFRLRVPGRRFSRRGSSARAALVALFLAAPAAAQEQRALEAPAAVRVDSVAAWPSALRDGRWAIDFHFPTAGSGGTIGAWNLTAPRRAWGIAFSVSVNTQTTERETDGSVETYSHTSTHLSLRPSLRSWFAARGPVAAYTELGASLGVTGRVDDLPYGSRSSYWGPTVGGHASLGVEWFVVDQLSIATDFDASASYRWLDQEARNPPLEQEQRERGFDLGVGGGQLRGALWF